MWIWRERKFWGYWEKRRAVRNNSYIWICGFDLQFCLMCFFSIIIALTKPSVSGERKASHWFPCHFVGISRVFVAASAARVLKLKSTCIYPDIYIYIYMNVVLLSQSHVRYVTVGCQNLFFQFVWSGSCFFLLLPTSTGFPTRTRW